VWSAAASHYYTRVYIYTPRVRWQSLCSILVRRVSSEQILIEWIDTKGEKIRYTKSAIYYTIYFSLGVFHPTIVVRTYIDTLQAFDMQTPHCTLKRKHRYKVRIDRLIVYNIFSQLSAIDLYSYTIRRVAGLSIGGINVFEPKRCTIN